MAQKEHVDVTMNTDEMNRLIERNERTVVSEWAECKTLDNGEVWCRRKGSQDWVLVSRP